MKAMRGILKWIIRREGRIGRVWRRRGVGGVESGSGKVLSTVQARQRINAFSKD